MAIPPDETTATRPFRDLLPVDEVGPDRFVVRPAGKGFLYGGLTMAIAIAVGGRTVNASFVPLSLRASFLAGGDWASPTEVAVERVSDSRSFAGRHLTLSQERGPVAVADLSFHRPVDGDTWQTPSSPPAAPPDALAAARVMTGLPVMEVRLISAQDLRQGECIHPYWARFPVGVGDDPTERAAALAFVADYFVIHTPFPAGSGADQGMSSRTVEHSMWFHRPADPADWLHVDAHALAVGGERFTSRGEIHDREGALVASFVQLGVIRPGPSAPADRPST